MGTLKNDNVEGKKKGDQFWGNQLGLNWGRYNFNDNGEYNYHFKTQNTGAKKQKNKKENIVVLYHYPEFL